MAKKKQKCPECEAGSPLWMTTYGDMTTLLLTFFVMIYSVGQVDPQDIQLILSAFKSSLGFFDGGQTLSRGRLEEMGMNMESLPSQTTGRSLSRAKKVAESVFKPEIQAKKVRVTEDERGIIISLVGADYFEPGSALLTPAIREVLKKSAGLLGQLNRFVRVEGHSSKGEDAYLSGSTETGRSERMYMNSWDLASARSVNVSVYLQDNGVRPSLLQAVSFGSYRPLSLEGDQGTPEASAHNRRVDLVIQPNVAPVRKDDESGYGLPDTRLPGFESSIKDF